ncbi:hypothetical protein T484DRAFT_1763695 [Baffinella frigidus]|nr:hypothetical protein T484DRAFT_1763695 [Cryptophyta sp. CCMP2293]
MAEFWCEVCCLPVGNHRASDHGSAAAMMATCGHIFCSVCSNGSQQSCPVCGLANGYEALPFERLPAALQCYTEKGGIDKAIQIIQFQNTHLQRAVASAVKCKHQAEQRADQLIGELRELRHVAITPVRMARSSGETMRGGGQERERPEGLRTPGRQSPAFQHQYSQGVATSHNSIPGRPPPGSAPTTPRQLTTIPGA